MSTRSATWPVEHAVAHAPPAAASEDASDRAAGALQSPFALDGWLEFNRIRWDVQPARVRLSEDGSEIPAVHAVYYLDRRGQVWQPPTNPYLPVYFEATPTQSRARLDRQWLTVGELLVEDMKARGLRGRVALPPEIDDVRPWQWAGFVARVQYRYYLDLSYSGLSLNPVARRQIEENRRAGFVVERVTEFDDVYRCLSEPERRRGARPDIDRDDLELARDLLGDEVLRAYVCYSPTGEPVSARVLLHQKGCRAVDWLAGGSGAHNQDDATLFLLSEVLSDVNARGASGFDFGIVVPPEVPGVTSISGGRLVPSYVIEAPTSRMLARHALDQWRYWRARWEAKRA